MMDVQITQTENTSMCLYLFYCLNPRKDSEQCLSSHGRLKFQNLIIDTKIKKCLNGNANGHFEYIFFKIHSYGKVTVILSGLTGENDAFYVCLIFYNPDCIFRIFLSF